MHRWCPSQLSALDACPPSSVPHSDTSRVFIARWEECNLPPPNRSLCADQIPVCVTIGLQRGLLAISHAAIGDAPRSARAQGPGPPWVATHWVTVHMHGIRRAAKALGGLCPIRPASLSRRRPRVPRSYFALHFLPALCSAGEEFQEKTKGNDGEGETRRIATYSYLANWQTEVNIASPHHLHAIFTQARRVMHARRPAYRLSRVQHAACVRCTLWPRRASWLITCQRRRRRRRAAVLPHPRSAKVIVDTPDSRRQ